jgi:hypothetical protein
VSDTGSFPTAAAQGRAARDAVVRPLARAAQRACVRPGCPSPARASLSFRYDTREAWLGRLDDEPRPESYDLCSSHAARTRPPHGWQLRDRRPREEQVDGEPPATPDHLGGEQTVAVLAAALRSVPAGDEVDGGEVDGDPAPPTTQTAPEAQPEETHGAGRLEDSASPVLEPPRSDAAAPSQAPQPDAAPPERELAPAPALQPDPEPEPQPQPQPRPVPAARERWAESGGDGAPGGPARHW